MPGAADAFGTALAVTACSLAGALPVLLIINAWLVDKTLSGAGAAACLSGVMLIFVTAISSWGSPLGMILMALLIGGAAATPLLGSWLNRTGLAVLDAEDIAKYQRTLEFDPGNAAAHGFLGEIYLRQKRYDEAIDHLRKAVELAPSSHQEKRLLQQALAAQSGDGDYVLCSHCNVRNPASAKLCAHCQEPLHGPGFFRWLMQPENLKQVTLTTVAVSAALALLVGVTSVLPPAVRLVLGGVVMVAGIAAFYLFVL